MRTRGLRLAILLLCLLAGFLAVFAARLAEPEVSLSWREPGDTTQDPCVNNDPLNCTWNGG